MRATTGALLLVALAGLARALLPSVASVIALSVPIGIGAGLAGTSLPTAIDDLYRNRATGAAVYALGVNFGALGAAALAVPVAAALGGWRGSFAFFGALALGMSAAWQVSIGRATERTRPPLLALPLRDGRAWTLTCLFALQGLCYYGFGAWLSDAYVERGWSQGAGGGLVAALTAATLPASFLLPRLSHRVGSRWWPLLASSLGLVAGALVLADWPRLAWAGSILVGLSLGGVFSLCVLLAIDLGRPKQQVAGVAGMMFGFGYTASAAAPIALGVARDAAGSFSTALWLLVIIAASIVALLVASRRFLAPAT